MKTQLDYKALDATRDERLRRIAEALTDCVMSARARPVSGKEWPPILTDQEIDEHIRATEHLPFAKTSDERRDTFRADRDWLLARKNNHDDSEGEANAG